MRDMARQMVRSRAMRVPNWRTPKTKATSPSAVPAAVSSMPARNASASLGSAEYAELTEPRRRSCGAPWPPPDCAPPCAGGGWLNEADGGETLDKPL